MAKRMVCALVLVALAALVGCASKPGAPPLTLGVAPWEDGDRVSYTIVDKQGNKLGTEDVSFAAAENAWVLTVADKAAPQLDSTATVRIDRSSLRPLSGEKVIKAQGTDATVSYTYAGGKLDIKAVVNGENRTAAVDVPANILDNDQLLMTLRALPFAEGYAGSYVNVIATNARKVNSTVRVTGKETVQVPAGAYSAWRVELNFAGALQSAWYQDAAPYNMVQYDNGTSLLVLTTP